MVTHPLVNMKLLLLVLALLGAATALKPRHEYFYYYTAETNIGLPEVAPTYSIVGIRSNVSIAVLDRDTLIMRLHDVRVASDIRKVEGGMHGYPRKHLDYRPVQGEARALEEPFKVFLRRTTETVMEVPKTDKEWLTNIRKSVANLVRIYPIIDIGEPTERRIEPEFMAEEYTIFGHCESHYTIKNISHQYLPMPGGRPAPTFGYDLCKYGAYNVTRSINLDKCRDKSMFQYTGLSNRTTAARMQHGSMESRSSVAHYTVCGRLGDIQIQNMTAQGLFSVNPYGFETEKMQAITNQTFRLSYIRPMQMPSKLENIRKVKTWLMEVASPYAATDNRERPWVNFGGSRKPHYPFLSEAVVTGEPHERMMTTFEHRVLEIIKRVAKILNDRPEPAQPAKVKLYDTEESEAPKLMQIATRLVRGMGKDVLVNIWKELHNSKQDRLSVTERILYTDCLAASGGSAGMRILLDHMSNGDITDVRAKSIFMTFTNNIVNPEILPELVDFAMRLKMEERPYLTTTVHVNLASTVRRACTDPKFSRYSVPQPILGEKRCDPSKILKKYLPYLEHQLEKSTKPFERAVYVEAIANLGSVQALPLIKQVIGGHHGRNASIRVMGIYALLHYRMPEAPKHQIIKILTPLFEDFMEDMQLRQTAILVVASWHPGNEFWQRLATLTWRDPSREIGSFIYSMTSTTSKATDPKMYKQAEYAKHALNRAKPYPPSFMYSYSYLWARLSPEYHLSTDISMTKISSNESVIPREIFSYLYNAYGGLDYTVIEQCMYSFNADELLFRVLDRMTSGYKSMKHPRMSRPNEFMDFFKIIKEELNFKGRDIHPYQLFYLLRMFDHMELFTPIDKDIMRLNPNYEQRLIDTLMKGTDMYLVKYFDPSPIEMYLPLESGLPMAYRVSYPIIISIIGDAKLRIPHVERPSPIDLLTASEVEFGMNKNAKVISTYLINIAAIVPWDANEVYTESFMTTNFNDPSQLNVTLINSVDHDYVNTTVGVYISANIESEYPVMHTHNVPVVGVRSMWPTQKNVQLREVFVAPNERPVEMVKHDIPRGLFGISGYVKYSGDVRYPMTMGNFYDILQHPQKMMRLHSATAKRWDYEMVVHPGNSETKSFNISTTVWLPTTLLSLPMRNYTRVKDQNVDHTRDYPMGMTARVHLDGRVRRYFEASVGVASMYDRKNVKDYGVRFTAHRSALPGISNQKGAFCVNMTLSTPKFYDFPEFLNFIQEGHRIESHHGGKMYMGEHCHQNEFGEFHGHMKVSEEERRRIEESMGQQGDYTPYDPRAPFYDRSEFVLDYNRERMQPFFRNMSYMAYDAMRGFAFPHVYFSYANIHNKQNRIRVEGNRLMKSHTWNGTIEMPTETVRFESERLPKSAYHVIPTEGLSSLAYECVMNETGVRTFDDVWYDLSARQLRNCWTVAAVNKKYPERMQILTRRPTSGYEAMISSTHHQINIEIRRDSVMVNGSPVKVTDEARWIHDPRGNKFAKVVSQFGKHEVSVPGNVTVSVGNNRIAITPFMSLKGKVNGICGDFNSERENEMIGPEDCYYRNPTKFSDAWATSHGKDCNRNNWKQAQEEVNKFQKSCAKAYPRSLPWELKTEKICEKFVYPILQEDFGICVCTDSQGICLPGCTETKHVITDELYDCYVYPQIPTDVTPFIARGYMDQRPHSLPDVNRVFRTRSSFNCE